MHKKLESQADSASNTVDDPYFPDSTAIFDLDSEIDAHIRALPDLKELTAATLLSDADMRTLLGVGSSAYSETARADVSPPAVRSASKNSKAATGRTVRISLRIPTATLDACRERAIALGIPYQSLLNRVIAAEFKR